MKRGLVIVVIVLVVVFASLFFVNANNSLKKNGGVVNVKSNNVGDYVQVFVKAQDNNFKKSMKNSAILAEGKNDIKYNSKNGFFANVSRIELESMRDRFGDENVIISNDKHIMLQDSVPIILANSTHVLQDNGVNLTGLGQTVCIIDTGVNYNHVGLGACYGNNNPASSCKIIGGWDFYNMDSDPMDDNGHGTHVAGIIAGSGGITGVAPGAKIIAIKACDSTGESCTDAAIAAGIEWCVNNASIFNISVISMSLGSGLYDDYCNGDPLASFINDSVSQNISVVIASGNDYDPYYISSPACVESAIPVSATNKNDVIANYANTNEMVMLLAPGTNINSTWVSGVYNIISGTSMATPHVAGAIAILNQYLSFSDRVKTPAQLELVLNNTGVRVQDIGYSELNFSRINVYSAVISLDEDSPNVTLVSPFNNSVNQSTNISFSCNASDLQLKNMTFYLWNSSGFIVNQTSFNISGSSSNISVNLSNLSRDSYLWNCLAGDQNGNVAFSAKNFSFILNNISTSLSSPDNDYYTNLNESNFSCSSNAYRDFLLSNVTFYLWNSSSDLIYNKTNIISGVENTSMFNYSFVNEGIYYWNCLSINNASQSVFADSNYSFMYDIVSPNLTVNSPTGTKDSTNVSFNVSLGEFGECNYSINSGENNSMTSSDLVFTDYYSLDEGSYTVDYFCSDLAGNKNYSTVNFVVDIPCSGCACTNSCGGGGSGGGGGGSSVVALISPEALSVGVTKRMGSGDKLTMNVGGFNHSLSAGKITNNSVNLTIRSYPVNFILNIGEEKRVNLSSADYYDLYIKLNSIAYGKANLTIKSIGEKIVGSKFDNLTGERHILTPDSGGDVEDARVQYVDMIIIIGSVFVLMIVFMVWRMIHLWKSEKKKK